MASPNDSKPDPRLVRSMETWPRKIRRKVAMIVLGRRFRAQQRASASPLLLPHFWWVRIFLPVAYLVIPAAIGGVIGAIHLGIPIRELFSFNSKANNALAPWTIGSGLIGLTCCMMVEGFVFRRRRHSDTPE